MTVGIYIIQFEGLVLRKFYNFKFFKMELHICPYLNFYCKYTIIKIGLICLICKFKLMKDFNLKWCQFHPCDFPLL